MEPRSIGNSPEILLETLPDHILVKIFSFVPVKHRLELMEICPKFNELITTTKALMKDISVAWKYENDDMKDLDAFLFAMLQSNRKYVNMRIESEFYSSFLFLTKFQSLVELSLYVSSMEMEDLKTFVNNLPNLEMLRTCYGFNLKNDKNYTGNLKCPKLKKYAWSIEVLLKFESVEKLTELKISRDDIPLVQMTELRKILMQLTNLKILDICDEKVFSASLSLNVKFQLSDLKLSLTNNLVQVTRFLKTQHELKSLSVMIHMATEAGICKSLLETIIIMPKLKILEISIPLNQEFDFEIEVPVNKTLESFQLEQDSFEDSEIDETFRSNVIRKIVSKMINLHTLEMDLLIAFQGEELNLLNSMKNLSSLSFGTAIHNSVLPHLKLPELKEISMEFRRVNPDDTQNDSSQANPSDLLKFFAIHRKLKNIRIGESMITKPVWKFLMDHMHYLDNFTLETNKKAFDRGVKKSGQFFRTTRDFTVNVNRGDHWDVSEVLITASRNKE